MAKAHPMVSDRDQVFEGVWASHNSILQSWFRHWHSGTPPKGIPSPAYSDGRLQEPKTVSRNGVLVWQWFDSLDALDPTDWMRRVRAQVRPSPFLTPAFLKPWAQTFAGEQKIGLWKESGLALFHRTDSAWELLGGQDVADRLDVIGNHPQMWCELRQESKDWGAPICFPNLAPDADVLCSRCPTDEVVETDKSPFVRLTGSFPDYLASLPKKSRHELKRKMARAERLAENGLHLQEGIGELETFLHLHRRSHPDKEAFMQGSMEQFFFRLCHSLQQAEMLWLVTLYDGDKPLAGMLQIRFEGVAHLYNSGYEPESQQLSPGLVLIARCIEQAGLDGLHEYDFLRGTERYKYDLGGLDREVVRMIWGGTRRVSSLGR